MRNTVSEAVSAAGEELITISKWKWLVPACIEGIVIIMLILFKTC